MSINENQIDQKHLYNWDQRISECNKFADYHSLGCLQRELWHEEVCTRFTIKVYLGRYQLMKEHKVKIPSERTRRRQQGGATRGNKLWCFRYMLISSFLQQGLKHWCLINTLRLFWLNRNISLAICFHNKLKKRFIRSTFHNLYAGV